MASLDQIESTQAQLRSDVEMIYDQAISKKHAVWTIMTVHIT